MWVDPSVGVAGMGRTVRWERLSVNGAECGRGCMGRAEMWVKLTVGGAGEYIFTGSGTHWSHIYDLFVCSGCWAFKGSCVLVHSQRRAIKMTGQEGSKCVHTGRWRTMIWAQDMTQSIKYTNMRACMRILAWWSGWFE